MSVALTLDSTTKLMLPSLIQSQSLTQAMARGSSLGLADPLEMMIRPTFSVTSQTPFRVVCGTTSTRTTSVVRPMDLMCGIMSGLPGSSTTLCSINHRTRIFLLRVHRPAERLLMAYLLIVTTCSLRATLRQVAFETRGQYRSKNSIRKQLLRLLLITNNSGSFLAV